jgi:SAM-dependent methyltransferase
VIEHFRNPAVVLARAAGLLRPGGVLAVSTPNGAGISGRRDRTAFLRASPDDHRTVWNPRAARRILRRFGFRPRRVVVTGHHPERFPWFRTGSSAQGLSARTAVFRLLALASRICRLGDTFELYAVKREKR